MNGLWLSVHTLLMERSRFSVRSIALTLSFTMIVLGNFGSPALAEGYASQQNLDWHYTVRPSDDLPSVSKRLLKTQYSWTSVAHYNNIENIDGLLVGSIIKIPISWLKYQPQPAKIADYTGVALLKRRQETRYTPIESLSHLYVGDELLTRDGEIKVEFADGTNVRLDAYSHLIFNKLSAYKELGMVDTRMRLSRGGLRTQVKPLTNGSRYEISTPSAVAAVRGTDFRLRTNTKGTALEVLEGTVEFIYEHGHEFIEAGFGARILAQSAIMDSIRLDALPRIANNLTNSEGVGRPESSKAAEQALEWQGLPKDFAGSQRTSTNVTSPVAAETESGTNAAMITAATSLQESAESDDIGTDTSEPSSPDAAVLDLPLPGSIVDGFTAEFTWTVNSPSTLSRIELAKDNEFSRLALPTKWSENTTYRLQQQLTAGNYFWRVRTLSAGNAESVSDSRAVSIQGKLDDVAILTVNYIGDQVGMFWHSVDNAKGYVFQVSDDKEFRRLLKEETLSKTRAFLKLPEGKKFYARVKGLGDEVYSSDFGPIKEVHVEPKPE